MRVLFICSQNRLRSPTAEQIFASWEGIEVASAGLANAAEKPVTPELLAWAHLIFVMEKAHRSRLAGKFRAHLGDKRIVCLDIPDEYHYMDAAACSALKGQGSATPASLMSFVERSPPNQAFERSAQQRRRWVPVALRAPAPGHCERWA